MLGLALGLAEKRIASLRINLCGHGENMSRFMLTSRDDECDAEPYFGGAATV
jgi:hypothetical protein